MMYLKYFAHSIEHLKFLLVPDTLKAQSVLVSTILNAHYFLHSVARLHTIVTAHTFMGGPWLDLDVGTVSK